MVIHSSATLPIKGARLAEKEAHRPPMSSDFMMLGFREHYRACNEAQSALYTVFRLNQTGDAKGAKSHRKASKVPHYT